MAPCAWPPSSDAASRLLAAGAVCTVHAGQSESCSGRYYTQGGCTSQQQGDKQVTSILGEQQCLARAAAEKQCRIRPPNASHR